MPITPAPEARKTIDPGQRSAAWGVWIMRESPGGATEKHVFN
jgi:hypothetical protein